MYETFFGLKRRPFLFVPDVESYFSVDFMEESRQAVERTVQKGEGNALVFGATGTGKSLLLRMLRQSLGIEHTAVLVSNSQLETPKALFLQLVHDLHLSCTSSETVELRLQILDFARKESSRGIVLLFDDAQHLSPAALEEIRLLTDCADGWGDTSTPLFHAVLAGTLDFEEKLTLPSLEAFNQRVVSRCYLDSFTGEQTSRYVARQTDDLRIDPPHSPLFTEAATRRIHLLTGGVPRLINQLCGKALQFAAEVERENVDEALINNAWATLQHIEPVCEEELATVQEAVLSPKQIEEMLDQKRKTFRIREFDSVEFGTLTDAEPEPVGSSRAFLGNNYKPPYPDDDDAEDGNLAELVSVVEEEVLPPFRALQLHAPADAEVSDLAPADQNPAAFVIPKRQIVPNFYKQERKFRRRYLIKKIRHRLGLFAGLRQKAEPRLPEPLKNEPDMNAQSFQECGALEEYGAAVLEGRPPFVRKEPQYAYQTSEVSHDVTYPDPKTGVPITLRWLPETTGDNERFGVSYTDFLSRGKAPRPKEKTVLPKTEPEPMVPELTGVPIIRTSLNASSGDHVLPFCCSGLEESFEESQQVGGLAISLTELFRAKTSALLRLDESPECKGFDEAIQRQLEAVVQRIIKAAEKIEQAAEVSERAGRHVSRAAEFVEEEVKSALPSYTDLFRQWSEFQDLISSELENLRQRNPESPQFRTFPRRQVMIERVIPAINVETLLR